MKPVVTGFGPAIREAERRFGPSGSCIRKPTRLGMPLPSRIPQLSVETEMGLATEEQVSTVSVGGREVCQVNTTGWYGHRVDRLTAMARRIYARGAL